MEMNNENIIILNTDDMEGVKLEDTGDIFSNRAQVQNQGFEEEITIVIKAFNRIEKLRNCVKYYKEYTSHIPHKLILIDNGSDGDEVFELFKSIEHPNKIIYRVTKNIGPGYPNKFFTKELKSKYWVNISDDAFVTKNWLDNMLECIRSDERIARVVPMSSNMSNAQDPGLQFSSLEEMQELAAGFNQKSDPTKWEERIRALGVVVVTKVSIINFHVQPDQGFFYDFSDDDGCLRTARAGYKQIVCGDTFIHHDHYRDVENDPQKTEMSLEKGRENFKQKYYGLDAWVDLLNYEINLLNIGTYKTDNANVLGIDTLCGIPLLEIRNKYKLEGNFNTNLYAFTTQAKHYHDLLFVTDNKVQCDRINFINDHYPKNAFDTVIVGELINKYPEPLKVLETALDLLLPGGQLLIKVKNTLDVKTLLGMVGLKDIFHQEIYTHLMVEDLKTFIKSYGITNVIQQNITEDVDDNTKDLLRENLNNLPFANKEICEDIFYKEYNFCIIK